MSVSTAVFFRICWFVKRSTSSDRTPPAPARRTSPRTAPWPPWQSPDPAAGCPSLPPCSSESAGSSSAPLLPIGHHPHLLAVLLPEQRHGPRGNRLIQRQDVRLYRRVLQNLLVRQALHFF